MQPAAEGWPTAISALLLGTAALGLASAAARARAAAPRMDLELGETDAEAPSAREAALLDAWLRKSGTLAPKITIGEVDGIRGCIAREHIAAGEEICVVPVTESARSEY